MSELGNIMKYKVVIGLAGCLIGSAGAKEYSKVDYMKLTRKSVPHMQVLVQGALDNTGIEVNSTKMTKAIRRGAFLPDLTLRTAYQPEGLAEYEQLTYQASERRTLPSEDLESSRNVTEHKQTGFTDRMDWGVTLEWDLTQLIHSNEERSLSARRVQWASLQRRRTVDVAKRYALLMGALPAEEDQAADPAKMAVILENAIMLDVWTGGMLTQVLEHQERVDHLKDQESMLEHLKSL